MPSASSSQTSAQIRSTFIDYFKAAPRSHTFVASSPCVPHDDPTLLFTNAGMNQFKPLFLGQADPSTPMGRLKRAVNSQKCIRAGGKHNDLDDVGKDTYHHTFFEMLGNWSFGDYFKQEAIDWSWELLTRVYGIPADALYATYFGGDTKAGIAPDLETRELWLKYLPSGRILPGNMKDNFWMMGDTGPCGPCTEIHVDRITASGQGKRDAAELVNSGDPMVLEIWNNVFIQFNSEYPAEGAAALQQWDSTPEAERGRLGARSRTDIEAKYRKLITLPAKHVDTGMGFERLVSVIKGVNSNYDTDVFAPLFVAIERGTHAAAYTGRLGTADAGNKDTAYRVIADHIRTLTFAITDGAVPSNEGRGYVLRRILRRAVRYGRQCLGAKPGFFSSLVPVLVDQMAPAFPELAKDPKRVAEIIKGEEESFARTLDRGIVQFNEAAVRSFSKARLAPHHQAQNQTVSSSRESDGGGGGWTVAIHEKDGHKLVASARIDEITPAWADEHFGPNRGIAGEDAFKLYDTYGFPFDLTKLMAEERGLSVDEAGFEKLMKEAKDLARRGGKFVSEGDDLTLKADALARLKTMNIAPTDDADKFHGREIRATIKAIWDGNEFIDHLTSTAAGVSPFVVILDKTAFYAEMGGQVGDTGRIEVLRAAGGSAANANDDDDRGTRGARENGGDFRVEDTKVYGGYVAHLGKLAKKDIKVGDEVLVKVDATRRGGVSGHHTATHLLNLGLRSALGEGVEQKGSLVAEDRLRFDFSHGKPVAPEELAKIEQTVQQQIKSDFPVYTDLVPLAKAKGIKGVRAVFGEAYPDPVRVVSVGRAVDHLFDNAGATLTSAEFCGGVHVGKTGEIGAFCLVGEEAVAKGIRRITALAGVPAKAAVMAGQAASARLDAAEKLSGDALTAEVKSLATEIDQLTIPLTVKQQLRARVASLQEKVKQAGKAASGARAAEVAAAARSIASSSEWEMTSCIITTIEAGSDRDALNAAVNTIRELRPRHGLLLISPDEAEKKLTIIAAVPDALQKRGLKAGDWVRETAAACGGRGGGKPDLAQGGGTDLTKIKEALAAARNFALCKCPV